MPHAVIDPALDELMKVIGECEHLVLHFHGPVCGMPAWSDSDVTSQLRGLLAGHGIQLPYPAGATISPYDILRFILTACPQLAGRAEAEVAAHEVRAAAVARPAVGIRSLLQGPAQVTIIGNVCPAAISTYLARLYPRARPGSAGHRAAWCRPGHPGAHSYPSPAGRSAPGGAALGVCRGGQHPG